MGAAVCVAPTALVKATIGGGRVIKFLLRRLLNATITLLMMSVVVFAVARLSGDPVGQLLPVDATPEQIQRVREAWGFDGPLHEQYFSFLSNALRGDFGESLRWRGQNAMHLVLTRISASLELAGVALLFSLVVSVPLGVLSAARRGTPLDGFAKGIALFGQSIPHFWLALMFMWIFGVLLRWLPTSGRGTVWHLIMPAVVIGWFHTSAMMRLLRSAMLEALESEYIKLARIKGVREWLVIWKHALRNAVAVPLTYFGIMLGRLLVGSIAIETVFSWPGAGRLIVDAIRARDFPVVQAAVLVFAAAFIVTNLLVDILYGYIDPRIRIEKRA